MPRDLHCPRGQALANVATARTGSNPWEALWTLW